MDENVLFQASTALPPWKERPVPIEEWGQLGTSTGLVVLLE
jgi:hypothetical protein